MEDATRPDTDLHVQDGIEGEIALPVDDPEMIRLMIEYMYLLDYEPRTAYPEDHESQTETDSISVRTEAGQYGQVYGTSAVSAFGGPAHQHSPYSAVFRHRADSSLTSHALPQEHLPLYSAPQPRRRRVARGQAISPPDPSPLATIEPNLTLHAKMYALGEQYGIAGLKALALDKFKIQLTRHWSVNRNSADIEDREH